MHAYTAACDSFEPWEKFLPGGKDDGKVGHNPNSGSAAAYNKDKEYQQLKLEKEEVLWKAIERVIPDVRKRAKRRGSIVLSGTPLTHRRYNQRFRGTYGPAPGPGKDVWELPGANTKIKSLLVCGDTTFPGKFCRLVDWHVSFFNSYHALHHFIASCFIGIGLPGVAASGTIAANTLVSVGTQTRLMEELKQMGALQ